MDLSKLSKITGIFSSLRDKIDGHKMCITSTDIEAIADKIIDEMEDIVVAFKSADKKWTWNIFKAYEIYKPVVSEVVEVVKVVGDQLKLTNEQRKELAEVICWKIISPYLPNIVKTIAGKVIRWGIGLAIDKIYEWLKINLNGLTERVQSFKVNSVR